MLHATADVVRTLPQAIPLAMTTMRKSTHGFHSLPYMNMALRLAEAFEAAGFVSRP